MPWQPLPRIAFAVATYPFQASSPADLPLELGDELYIIEEGGKNGQWLRGYLIAPPSLLAGLTSTKGQTLEARVFSGIFPRSCVEVREVLGEDTTDSENEANDINGFVTSNGVLTPPGSDRGPNHLQKLEKKLSKDARDNKFRKGGRVLRKSSTRRIPVVAKRDPGGSKPPAPVPMLKIGDETPTSISEPLVDEIASCLREWHSTNLHELLLSRRYSVLERMASLYETLDFSRQQLLHNVLTAHELRLLREKTVWDLVKGNKLFNSEVIVRSPAERGRVLTEHDSAVEITKLQSMMSLLDDPPQSPTENLALHHLLLEVKTFASSSTDSTTLVFYLASKAIGAPTVTISENFIVEMPANGSLSSLTKAGQTRTLFTNLTSTDIGDSPASDNELYLVVKVRQSQQLAPGRNSSSWNGLASRDEISASSNNTGDKPLSNGTRSVRRSLMWGKNTQRSKNTPASKLASLAEYTDRFSESRDGAPPSTASSRGTNGRPKSATTSQTVARTVCVGAVKLNAIMKYEEEVVQLVTMWAPSTRFDLEESYNLGDGWEDVIRDLIKSKSGHYDKSRKAERLQIQLRPFVHHDPEALIKATPTLLSEVIETNKMGFSGAPTKPRSDIYITFIEAFLPHHALLSRSTGSATPLSSSLLGSNLQLTLEIRKSTGERVENCISTSSNSELSSVWLSNAAERGESWSQSIRLVVPADDVPSCHIMVTLADAPNQAFAICHMPLWDQQAFIRDGHHSLLLYKYDDTTSSARPSSSGKGGYLTLPWNARGKDDTSKDETVTGPISVLKVQSYLCSTQFSQDKVLLGILRWKEQRPTELLELIKRLVFVPEIEIVKLLPEVFDAIFGILVDHTGNDEYEDLVFSALVTVLGIVHDRRFNLGPLVDNYAENKFNYPFATPCLVRSFTRLLAHPTDPEVSRRLRATFKVVRHILKFITHARDLQKAKEAGIGITSTSPGFSRHLRSIFKFLDGLMENTDPLLVGSQTLAVQHFHTWLPELSGLLTTEEILHIAIDFMDSCAKVKGKLVLYKLLLIINYSRLDIFSKEDQRSALAANTVRWLEPHWGKTTEFTEQWREQVRLCCSVLATQLNFLGPEVPDYIPKIIDSYLAIQAVPKEPKTSLSLLFPTTYPFPTKAIAAQSNFDEALVELTAILSDLSTLPNGMQLELTEDEMATLLENILRVHLSILQCEAFPAPWLSVHIYHHKSAMKTLQYLAGILLESFLPEPDDAGLNYNIELWKMFFTTLLKLVGSDALALETFPEQKRRAVWKIAGDVREHGAELLRHTWEATGWDTTAEEYSRYGLAKVGGYQVQYVPVLVGPIAELCLSVHEGLRRVAVEVLQTMIISEWSMSEDLSVIQTEMIDCLDNLFKSKPLTEGVLQKLFINELLDLFEPLSQISNDSLYSALKALITTIDEFLDLLVAVHSTDVIGEASHLVNCLRMMEFLRDMQKEEIFVRYVHQLAKLQSDARNFTEAGLALLLHADIYEWDPTRFVPASVDPEFPAQSQFDRKERIYFDMIKHFEDGEAWNSALAAYKELQDQYEQNVFDFSKLARAQRAMATIYENISNNDKIVPKYFRVTYKGMGFPPSIRDKDFVFEGSPTERTSAFTDRMQKQHPSAQIVTSGEIEDVEGQFLLISPLSPHRDLGHPIFQRARVQPVIRDYIFSSRVQHFSMTNQRSAIGPVATHWTEKTVFTTAEPFPTILRRSEIVSVDHIKLNALQTGIERITRKTQGMNSAEKRIADGEDNMVQLLIEAINISVDSTSDSSVARYRELLPTVIVEEEESESEPDLGLPESALKMALVDHAIMIKRCLSMFQKSSYLQFRSEYDELSQKFNTTFSPELASLSLPQSTRLSPSPAWRVSLQETSVSQSFPTSQTNGTIKTTDTSILDTPTRKTQQDRNRLSFLHRNKQNQLPVPLKINGSTNTDDTSSLQSPSKENRRSSSMGNNTRTSENGDGGDGDWVTDSGLDGGNETTNSSLGQQDTEIGVIRRSNSLKRLEAAALDDGRVKGVKKRLSLLKLGKKSSKVSVVVDSVLEE